MNNYSISSREISDRILLVLDRPNWSSIDVAQCLTEDALVAIARRDFKEYDFRIRQAVLLSILTMDKQTIDLSIKYLNKVNNFLFWGVSMWRIHKHFRVVKSQRIKNTRFKTQLKTPIW
jgi:hypothetical protein